VHVSALDLVRVGGGGGKAWYQWLSQTQFLCQAFARVLPCVLICGLEEVAHKVAGGTCVGGGAEGEEQKGHIQRCGGKSAIEATEDNWAMSAYAYPSTSSLVCRRG